LKKKLRICLSKKQLKQFVFSVFFLVSSCTTHLKNTGQLKVISSVNYHKKQVILNPNFAFLEIKKSIPSIVLDIKYATSNNFTGIAVYKTAKAYARKPVVFALEKVQQSLGKKGLGLKIYDAYRPYSVTVKFWNITALDKKDFVANPAKGSRHNRGCAVDVTLINLKTGQELEMPTPYDSFLDKAYADFSLLPDTVLQNRKILQDAMTSNGFNIYKYEWWHFDFKDWQSYDLMDIEFEKLR